MKPTNQRKNGWHVFFISLVLAATTVAVYWPIKTHEFINYDDPEYVTTNTNVTGGLTFESVKWAFTNAHSHMWHPLTSISHILDYELFGLDPAGHHLTNLLLHIANILLLFTVLKKMTGSLWKSAFVAALFALHPLGVESVAWVAERKNLLAGFFWLLAITAYIRYTKKTTIGRYLLVCVIFIMALMSKPVTVTLPFALLLLDFWPLNRFRFSRENDTGRKFSNTKIILEKVPMLFLSAAVCVITIIVQHGGGAVKSGPAMSLDIRLANAIVSYLRYIFKIFYPAKLAVFYPHPLDSLPPWQPVLYLAILIIITIAVVFWGRQYRYLIMGWFWFLGTLVPVIGIIQAGDQAMADRYTYLPSIGIFIVLAWGVGEIAARRRYAKFLLGMAAVIVLITLIAGTRIQLSYWQNSVALFRHTLEVTQNNFIAYNNLGTACEKLGRYQEAIDSYKKAIQINPASADVLSNLGVACAQQGRYQEAIDSFKQAIKVNPDYAEAHYNIGNAYLLLRLRQEAVESYKQAIRIKPDYAKAHSNLGVAYTQLGRYPEAIESLKQAISIKPEHADAHANLGITYLITGDRDSALKEYEILKNLDAEQANKLFNLLK